MRPKKAKNNYIDSTEFLNEVIQSKQNGACTERLGQLLLELHQHILTLGRFSKKPPDVKEEMQSYSLYRILSKGLFSFEDTSSAQKCFNYFTTAAINNMTQAAQRIEAYQKKMTSLPNNVIQKYRDQMYNRYNYKYILEHSTEESEEND